jgi:muconolactone delta-isomerase
MRFMVKSYLNQPPTDEIMALIPAEMERGKEMVEQGITQATYVAADQSAVWLVWNCDSPEAAQDAAKSLPMYSYLSIEITPLAAEAH